GTGRKGQNYLELFDFLEGEAAFDAAELQKKFAGTKLLDHHRSIQTRLKELLLKAMRNLHGGKSLDSRLRQMLEDIEFLFAKRQLKQCRKKVLAAKALASEFQKEAVLLQLLNWEQEIFLSVQGEESEAFFARMEREVELSMARFATTSGLHRLHEYMRAMYRQNHRIRDAQTRQRLDLLLQNPLLTKAPDPANFLATVYFKNIMGLALILQGKKAEARRMFEGLMTVWDAHPRQIPANAELYLGHFNNCLNIIATADLGPDGFSAALKKLRSVQGLPKSVSLKFQRISYVQEILYFLNHGGFAPGDPLTEEIKHWLDRNRKKISPARDLVLSHNIAQLLFLSGDFSGANRWLLRILNYPKGRERQDVRDFARLFQLVLQYELGNLDLQAYLTRSTKRYFTRTQKGKDFETAVLDFMRKAPAQLTRKEKMAYWEALKATLEEIIARKGEPRPVGILNLIFWAESKIRGISIREEYARRLAEAN
ncbi:MAG: hypothetical protein AAF570_19290, partial [Bacteroidota bacterium]